MPHSLPTVSALMGAYNYRQYVARAIESALAQHYPPELLEVIVIDDGSTDHTAEIVAEIAERNQGRVRLIRQANGGYIAATNRAIAEADGELLALLDADDVWLPDKTQTQVEMLQSRPELGLVFGDMVVVDAEEQIVRPSQIGQIGPLPARAYARLLIGNVATQSSIMVRSELKKLCAPIPAGVPYADWWLTLNVARVAQIDYVREPVALYREHGANLTGGVVGGAGGVREHRKEVAFQLSALRHLPLEALTPDEMALVWNSVEGHARMVIESAGSFFVDVTEVLPEHHAESITALAAAERLGSDGDIVGAAAMTLRALAWDPYRLGVRERLGEAVATAKAAAAVPHPLDGAREFVVLADAEELLDTDELLIAYADAFAGSDAATLAIDASRLPAEAVGHDLRALVERCGLSDRVDIDLLAVIGVRDPAQRHRMVRAAHARYRREQHGQTQSVVLPVFTPASLGQLRAFAEKGAQVPPAGAV